MLQHCTQFHTNTHIHTNIILIEFLPLKNQSNKMFETMKPREFEEVKKVNKSLFCFSLSHNKIMTRMRRDNKRSDLCFLLSINSFFMLQIDGGGGDEKMVGVKS